MTLQGGLQRVKPHILHSVIRTPTIRLSSGFVPESLTMCFIVFLIFINPSDCVSFFFYSSFCISKIVINLFLFFFVQHNMFIVSQVTTVKPSLFLEAAFASNDSQRLATVLRFFLDFIPDFQKTADFNTYCRALTETNSSVNALSL